MQTSGPFNLTLNTTTRITVPVVQGGGQNFSACVLTNMSPFVCQVSVLGASYAKWLAPGVEELVPMNQLVTEIDVTPQVATTPIQVGGTAVVTATWIDAQSPQLQDTWPNSAGIGGVITAFQQNEVAFVGSPFTFTLAGTHTFAIPANSPPFSDIFLGYITGSGSTALISAAGATTGIIYMLPIYVQQGGFLTFPFSTVADPAGITLTVSFTGASTTATFAVIGLVYPTSVRPYFGTAGSQGPTNYAEVSVAGTLIPGGTTGQVVRLWSVFVSGANSGAVGVGEVSIALAGAPQAIITTLVPAATAGANGTVGSTSLTYPGGLPIITGTSAINMGSSVTTARAGAAYSLDST